jgi:hypothetical protein
MQSAFYAHSKTVQKVLLPLYAYRKTRTAPHRPAPIPHRLAKDPQKYPRHPENIAQVTIFVI